MALLPGVDELDGAAAVVIASVNYVSDRVRRNDLVSCVRHAAAKDQ